MTTQDGFAARLPKTAAGRAITAGNALKTGAYSAQVVLPTEDATQFDALEAQLTRDSEPVGVAETAMVHDLAVLTWKKLRIDRVEHAVLMQMIQLPLLEETIRNSFGADFFGAAMPRLVPYRPVTQEEFHSTTALVTRAQTLLAQPSARQRATLCRKCPLVYPALQAWAEESMLDIDDLLRSAPVDAEGADLSQALEDIIADAQPLLWLWENSERVQAALRRAQESRLLTYMKTDNTQRAYEDTGRAFYRTLAELRKQQDWRIRRTAVMVEDVTPLSPNADVDAPVTR